MQILGDGNWCNLEEYKMAVAAPRSREVRIININYVYDKISSLYGQSVQVSSQTTPDQAEESFYNLIEDKDVSAFLNPPHLTKLPSSFIPWCPCTDSDT